MENKKIKDVVDSFTRICKVILLGGVRMIHGTLTAGLLAMSIYGFIAVCYETGWVAVASFILACATLSVFAVNVYAIGNGCKRRKKNG